MSRWEYCSIWTSYRKSMLIFDEPYLLFEQWSPDVNYKPIPLEVKGDLYPKIAQMGLESWEMIEWRTKYVEGENIPSRRYLYILFRRPVEREAMSKWEYCRIYHVKVSETFTSDKMKCVIEYFKPDGANVIQDAPSQNVHSVAASLGLDGWEIVEWEPPIIEYKLADRTGHILMKRSIS